MVKNIHQNKERNTKVDAAGLGSEDRPYARPHWHGVFLLINGAFILYFRYMYRMCTEEIGHPLVC